MGVVKIVEHPLKMLGSQNCTTGAEDAAWQNWRTDIRGGGRQN
jgi:hypothetical protein